MNHPAFTVARRRAARFCARGLLIAGLAAALAGCNTTTATDTTGGIPIDYRDRHPIAVKEGKKTLTLFVGAGRGGLSPMQRAEVLAFAQNWKRDATGGVTIDRPVGGRQRARGSTTRSRKRCRSSCRPACPTAASASGRIRRAATEPRPCG